MDRPQHLRRVPKPQTVRGKALRGLAGFLALMAMLTLLSRIADELTIPTVTFAQPRARTIDRKITGYGKAEELSARAVTSQPGIIVAGVAVKEGGFVEAGEPLFTLDEGDLEDKLSDARKELEQLDMDIRDYEGREELNARDRASAASRANEDYAAAQKAADKEVDRAANALEEAQKKLDGYSPPKAVDTSELEREASLAAERLEAAQEELDRLKAEVSEEAEYQQRLEAAQNAVDEAEKEKLLADGKLEEAKLQASQPDQTESLKQAVELAKQDYDRALDSRESSLRQAGRMVEDAQKPSAPDSSGEKLKMRREEQAKEVEKLQGLIDSGCVVRAPESGTVTGVSVAPGSPTPQGTAVLLAGSEGGSVFTAQIGSDWEKYIGPGDPVSLKPSGDKDEITGLEVESVSASAIEGLLDVSVRLPEGTLPIGAAAELTCLRKSEQYPSCVPISALRSENDVYFLLVPETTQTILGPQTILRRVEVTVIERNESYAAIDGFPARDKRFVLYSSKPVNAGDRVRQELS